MDALMIGLAFVVIVVVFFCVVAHGERVKATKKLSPEEEARFELCPVYITPDNIDEILDSGYQHAMSDGPEHPALIARKKENS